MEEEYVVTMKRADFEALIQDAIKNAIGKYVPREEDKLFNVEEAAKYLNISTVTLWQKRKGGIIPFVKTGRMHLFTKSALDAFLGSNKKEVVND